jgi:hypothetical protein
MTRENRSTEITKYNQQETKESQKLALQQFCTDCSEYKQLKTIISNLENQPEPKKRLFGKSHHSDDKQYATIRFNELQESITNFEVGNLSNAQKILVSRVQFNLGCCDGNYMILRNSINFLDSALQSETSGLLNILSSGKLENITDKKILAIQKKIIRTLPEETPIQKKIFKKERNILIRDLASSALIAKIHTESIGLTIASIGLIQRILDSLISDENIKHTLENTELIYQILEKISEQPVVEHWIDPIVSFYVVTHYSRKFNFCEKLPEGTPQAKLTEFLANLGKIDLDSPGDGTKAAIISLGILFAAKLTHLT